MLAFLRIIAKNLNGLAVLFYLNALVVQLCVVEFSFDFNGVRNEVVLWDLHPSFSKMNVEYHVVNELQTEAIFWSEIDVGVVFFNFFSIIYF